MIPGEIFLGQGEIEGNREKDKVALVVKNTGDRPVQVGSHFHFFEVNRALVFDRPAAFGRRLNIPAGTAVRFEPGQEKEVHLVPFGGKRICLGLNALTEGPLDDPAVREKAIGRCRERGFGEER